MRTVLQVGAALAAGAIVAGGCYWLFLNTPESRGVMLGISALLAAAIVATAAISVSTALMLAAGHSWKASLGQAVRSIHLFLAAAVTAAFGISLVARADSWLQAHFGQISAWFIAAFNWSDTRWLLTAAVYASEWLRWLVLPLAALALLHTMLIAGVRGALTSRWVRAGWHWRTLVVATCVYILLIRVPWRWAAWRPASLPPTWVEPAFAAVRLGIVVGLTLLAAAVATTIIARRIQAQAR